MLENSSMSQPQADPAIYTALLALKPDDLKLGPWAEKAGLARNYFNGLRQHGNPKKEAVDALLRAIGRTEGEVVQFISPVKTEVAGTGLHTPEEVKREFYGEKLPALPLVGSAFGGEYGDLDEHVELTCLSMGEVLDYLVRPASLANDVKAYALTIVGESMRPRFRPGERVGVSPKAPVSIGDDVIVQLRGPDGNDGESVKTVLIKELVRRTASHVELRQYNPDMTFRVETKRIAAMHLVRANFF